MTTTQPALDVIVDLWLNMPVPELDRIGCYKILMHFDEHPPPHFHVMNGKDKYKFLISDLEPFDNGYCPVPSRVRREIRRWAKPRQDAIMGAWEDAMNGRRIRVIK